MGDLQSLPTRLREKADASDWLTTGGVRGLLDEAAAAIEQLALQAVNRLGRCATLEDRCARLEAQVSALTRERDEAHAAGVAEERSRVVARLRASAANHKLRWGASGMQMHYHYWKALTGFADGGGSDDDGVRP